MDMSGEAEGVYRMSPSLQFAEMDGWWGHILAQGTLNELQDQGSRGHEAAFTSNRLYHWAKTSLHCCLIMKGEKK